jgi:hypothetical protein
MEVDAPPPEIQGNGLASASSSASASFPDTLEQAMEIEKRCLEPVLAMNIRLTGEVAALLKEKKNRLLRDLQVTCGM